MDDIISVVIPVYNVSKYICKCIDSVLNQTYRNLEIILVNDGSTDNSGNICDEYAKIDPRIKVIHKLNGGLSSARNAGIKISNGYYITFIDSDDYIDNTYIEYLYYLIKNNDCDVSICNPAYFYENTNKVVKNVEDNNAIERIVTGEEALQIMLYQNHFDTSAPMKMYKTSLWRNIYFPDGKLFEDLGTIYKIFAVSKRVVYSNAEKYYYLQRNSSIMGVEYNMAKNDYLNFAIEIYEFVKNEAPKCENAARSRIVSVAANLTMQMYKNSNKQYKTMRYQMYKYIKKYRVGLIFDKKLRKKNKVIILMSYCPFNIYDFLLNFFRYFNKK